MHFTLPLDAAQCNAASDEVSLLVGPQVVPPIIARDSYSYVYRGALTFVQWKCYGT